MNCGFSLVLNYLFHIYYTDMVVLISTLQINILSSKSCILIIIIFSKVTFILTKCYFFENNYNSSETITTNRIKY